jgi:hypothetical protein
MSEPCPAVVDHDLGAPFPALPDPFAAYVPRERAAVPDSARKLAAIGAYRSQLGADPDHDWLTTFARAEEIFWPEDLVCAAGRCSPAPAPATRVSLSPTVPAADVAPYHLQLDATAETLSLARGDSLLRHWTLPLAKRDRPHDFDVLIAPRPEDHATEVTVLREGALLGVAIDL